MVKRYLNRPEIDEPLVEQGTGTTVKTYLVSDKRASIVADTDGLGSKAYTNKYGKYGKPDSNNQGIFQYTGQFYLGAAEL